MKLNIPIFYETKSGLGKYLTPVSIIYNEENEIIEVDHWDGDGIVKYKKGEFAVDNSDKEMDCLVCNIGKGKACKNCCRDWDKEGAK